MSFCPSHGWLDWYRSSFNCKQKKQIWKFNSYLVSGCSQCSSGGRRFQPVADTRDEKDGDNLVHVAVLTGRSKTDEWATDVSFYSSGLPLSSPILEYIYLSTFISIMNAGQLPSVGIIERGDRQLLAVPSLLIWSFFDTRSKGLWSKVPVSPVNFQMIEFPETNRKEI